MTIPDRISRKTRRRRHVITPLPSDRGSEQIHRNDTSRPTSDVTDVEENEATKTCICLNLPKLSKEQAQSELLEHIEAQCCYNKKVAKQLDICDVIMTSAWQYRLETVRESRVVVDEEEPYNGEKVDGPRRGQAPLNKWDIDVTVTSSNTAKKRIPHTSERRSCVSCQGNGTTTCGYCTGNGKLPCYNCHGSGHTSVHETYYEHSDSLNQQPRRVSRSETCHECGGSGNKICCNCHGRGRGNCGRCEGRGEVVAYKAVYVKHTTLRGNKTTNTNNLPLQLFQRCGGAIVHEEAGTTLTPLSSDTCLNIEMQIASEELLAKHTPDVRHRESTGRNDERIILQTHIVRLLPIYTIHYTHRGDKGAYWIVGMDKKMIVHAPGYPSNTCGCNIM
nr:protein SSUH2 homolog isoform X2 [Ciona intestinalis]|eukprot:XP_002129682.1 protein SSUH2 homolog isoform X2 [Ciona intestinalis]